MRVALVVFVFLVSLVLTLMKVEQFPFSNYPMYAEAQLSRQRLTMVLTEKNGTRRLIQNSEIYPLGRIHLGFLLRHAMRGHSLAQVSSQNLANGLLSKNLNLEKIEIAVVSIDRPQSRLKNYNFEEVKVLKSISRDGWAK